VNSFILAWQFLTILPWPKSRDRGDPRDFGRSMAYFPAVGFILGVILWGGGRVFGALFPQAVADGLVIFLLVILTGAFHLDGLADTLDGLAFGRSPERRLQIMKEHAVGSFGVVGLILVLGLKYTAYHSLPAAWAGPGITAALMLGRGSMVQVLSRSPYARPEGGLGKIFKEHLGTRELVVSGALSLVFSLFFFRIWGFFLWLATAFFSWGWGIYFRKKIGGVTGDVLGAASELNETLTLLLLSGLLSRGVVG
jgi:adenosylcobinamide-GDP ribazoletransferase